MVKRLFLLIFVIILSVNNLGCAAGLICLGAGAVAATVAVVQDNRDTSEYEEQNQENKDSLK